MSRRMLIDGTHPEETRVVVMNGNKLDEYDIETSTKVQLKGNIYLAKVTRVEPSLQAAFVDFGGNRHGFLAFSEIHPDYYQIPIEDREALMADQTRLEDQAKAAQAHRDEIDGDVAEDGADDGDDEDGDVPAPDGADEDAGAGENDAVQAGPEAAGPEEAGMDEPAAGDEDEKEKPARRGRTGRRRTSHRYSIQEVIRRRQILLVQVVKEERGNKGAALTTYLSLAGRYCVLMPNAARGGGISRKITSAADRKRLKELLNDLKIADGMGVIMRTAGMERSKAEIKRDFDYLMRSWEDVRALTLESEAPTLVYEEGNLIKRAIRDLYHKDIDEVWVEGTETYQAAKKFMRMMMPSHAKRVQPYLDEETAMPLFHRFQVEGEIEDMHSPVVQLKSGGYIVINPTEALVSIDVNSGRSTRERNIEETALKTNLEAADEIALQLRLRDLAGLIVIDFIDMEVTRNQRAVEKCVKEAVKNDRARIQLGRISAFGLFEMSRQRLRPSLIEASTETCPHCNGSGALRSTESTAMRVLRAIEEEGIRRRSSEVSVAVPTSIALYLLNQKRGSINAIEERYGFSVMVLGDDELVPPNMRLERVKTRSGDAVPESIAAEGRATATEQETGAAEETESGRKRRPRRRRKKTDRAVDGTDAARPDTETEAATPVEAAPEDGVAPEVGAAPETAAAGDGEETTPSKHRRRGRRGGRRRGRQRKEGTAAEGPEAQAAPGAAAGETAAEAIPEDAPAAGASAPTDAPVQANVEDAAGNGDGADGDTPGGTSPGGIAPEDKTETEVPAEVLADPADPAPRRGWWQRIIE